MKNAVHLGGKPRESGAVVQEQAIGARRDEQPPLVVAQDHRIHLSASASVPGKARNRSPSRTFSPDSGSVV